jgi:DNA-binding transcriptional MerR regulator
MLERRFTEPVALSSTASTDLSPSGLAAFRVQPLETISTYSRSVLGAAGNLAAASPRQEGPLDRTAATSAKSFCALQQWRPATPCAANSAELVELDFECARSSMVDAMAEPERHANTLSIADAAESSGLSAHTLRYYEREGLLEPVSRNGSGHRRYRAADLELIAFLTKLRATGMPIREVRRYAELMRAGDATNAERLALLEAHRDTVLAGLETTTRNLELIEWKIRVYEQKIGVDKEGRTT